MRTMDGTRRHHPHIRGAKVQAQPDLMREEPLRGGVGGSSVAAADEENPEDAKDGERRRERRSGEMLEERKRRKEREKKDDREDREKRKEKEARSGRASTKSDERRPAFGDSIYAAVSGLKNIVGQVNKRL